jgi:hypothetical protein
MPQISLFPLGCFCWREPAQKPFRLLGVYLNGCDAGSGVPGGVRVFGKFPRLRKSLINGRGGEI